MKANGSATLGQNQIQGMVIKVKPQGDGTLRFRVTCHDSKGRVAHYKDFYLPPESSFREKVVAGRRARVTYEQQPGRPRATPLEIELVSE